MTPTAEVLARTLAGRVALYARERAGQTVIRHKRHGVWQEIDWQTYGLRVAATARALWDRGVRAGDRVAILSDNRPEWLYVDLGTQTLGARSVGIYPTSTPRDVAYILNHCRARVLICDDREQVSKLMHVASECAHLEHVWVLEPRGTRSYPEPRLSPFASALSDGAEALELEPGWLDDRLAALDPSIPTIIAYTSGTTGRPKGALLAPDNAVAALPALVDALGLTDRPAERILSYLPLPQVTERLFTLLLPLATPTIVHFGESVDTVLDDLREVSPTIFFGVPRVWEKLFAEVQIRMQNSSWLKRQLFAYYSHVGVELAEEKKRGRLRTGQRLGSLLGDMLVFAPLQRRLGLRHCHRAIAGGAPISPELVAMYGGLGITIREGFGMTETIGLSHLTRVGSEAPGTVGQPLLCMQQRIAEDGEILLRGPTVFQGYLDDEQATVAALDGDGWLHTGDIGEIDGAGLLRITGRKREIFASAGGENVSPERIENALKTSPYIREAVAIGDGRRFVTALVQVEFDTVAHWAQQKGVPYTSFDDLSRTPEVAMLIDGEIQRANGRLSPTEHVKRFELLHCELSQDNGELTATQRVRRTTVSKHYCDLIETMYLEAGA